MTNWRYGDIVIADLDLSKGHERIKRRPVLVVSNDDFNKNCSLTICAAISHGRGDYELHLPFKPAPSDHIEGGCVDGLVQIEQIEHWTYLHAIRKKSDVSPTLTSTK